MTNMFNKNKAGLIGSLADCKLDFNHSLGPLGLQTADCD